VEEQHEFRGVCLVGAIHPLSAGAVVLFSVVVLAHVISKWNFSHFGPGTASRCIGLIMLFPFSLDLLVEREEINCHQ